MADSNRRCILALLKKSEQTPTDMLPYLNISSSGLSKHLRRLRDVDLIKEKKEGKKVIYSLNETQIHSRQELFDVVLDHSMKGLQEYFKNKRSRGSS